MRGMLGVSGADLHFSQPAVIGQLTWPRLARIQQEWENERILIRVSGLRSDIQRVGVHVNAGKTEGYLGQLG